MSENKYAIINLKKMHNKDLAKIAEHNRRKSPTGTYTNPNIDPKRTHLNVRRSDHPEKELKTLIDLVSESNVSELEITEAEGKVRIVKGGGTVLQAPAPVAQARNEALELTRHAERF